MAELKQCEFFLLRYVPDAVKGEFVNIGVVLVDGGKQESAQGYTGVRFTQDWSRVRCMDPDADIEMLQAMETEVREQLSAGGQSREVILKKLSDSFSNTLQISSTKGCLTESPDAELDTLARHYLETASARKARSDRGAGARLRIAGQVKRSFEQAGVWELMMKKIPASKYTAPGDPLKIDCGYKPNGIVRLFHAVALKGNTETAKVLAFSYPQISSGMEQETKAKIELTAIVEDDLDQTDPEISFGISTLQKSDISIAGVRKMEEIAALARRELKV